MNIYEHKTLWKLALLLFAITIGLLSLFYTNSLVKKLKAEERKKVELWAEATRQLIISTDTTQILVFIATISEDNSTVPVILTDKNDSILSYKNFDPLKSSDARYMKSRLEKMKLKGNPIIIDLGSGWVQKIYYRDSTILTNLTWYPYVQLSVIILFILVSYLAFSASRKAEQNQVWVGMSKETAHQLGTPASSLAAWVDILREKYPEITLSDEMSKDIERLERVTERFSKIGSKPNLSNDDIIKVLYQSVEYLRKRTSSKILFNIEPDSSAELIFPVNPALFSWVIENVCRNAVDATGGEGVISICAEGASARGQRSITIDITDNGKGIPRSLHKKIFRPGFTTKKTGWGLGLSLAKRIIEEYHNGRIFVKHSEPGKGTCVRIIMKTGPGGQAE